MDWTIFVNVFTIVAMVIVWTTTTVNFFIHEEQPQVWAKPIAMGFWIIALPTAVIAGIISFLAP